ncbi:hypothetical protein FSP39_006332 [Pinctada imbricata]|uniref:Uncharacterized protein n=1 Tax=Pinctada imbricata TaxID=66713 RepID=A0AA88YHY9_PINIB|nr:hypothetical protein FSP39_006332 [Pinctada imbricata]
MEYRCNTINQKIGFGERAILRFGGLSAPTITTRQCLATFTVDPKYNMQVDVNILRCDDNSVTVRVQYDGGSPSYACRSNPSSGSLTVRGSVVTLGLERENSAWQYSVEVVIKAIEVPFNPNSTETSPISAGLVAGIVSSIFVAIILLAIMGVCCHKRIQRAKRRAYYNSETKETLDYMDGVRNPNGYNDSGVGMDYETSPKSKTKLLSDKSSTQSSTGRENGSNDRPQTLNVRNIGRPMTVNEMNSSPTKSRGFSYEEEDDKDPYDVLEGDPRQPKPKSPFLSALHSNPKFRRSHDENEKDAENRRKRISYSSGDHDQSQDSQTSGEITPPPLPTVPASRSPVSKKKNHASIRRTPRPVSSSSEDHISKSGDDADDPNIRVVRDSNDSPSSTEVIPIKVSNSTKPDTRHTLRPNRGRNLPPQSTPETRPKNKKSIDVDWESPPSRRKETPPSRVGQFQKYEEGIRSSKRSNKSPKVAAKGLGHRRRGDDSSRPTTPTSMAYEDDLESFPPLERTSSKNSLYASRSSLYNRRRRKNSIGESVTSYAPSFAHDDIDFYQRRSREYSRDYRDYDDDDSDGYVQPISRHEKARMFRSLGDLEHERRQATTATQTLRETATQTGKDQNVVMSKKRVVPKKRRSKSLSAAGTQTRKDKEKARKEGKSSESDTEITKKEKKRATEANTDTKKKSRPDLPEKPKPKPKPKPRKSQSVSAVSAKDDASESGEKPERKRKKKKKAASVADNAEIPQTAQNTDVPAQYPSGMAQPYIVPGQPFMQYGAPHGYQTLPNGQVAPVPGQPFYGVHPQAYGIRPPAYPQGQPPQQPAHVPGKPRKSNWELLCQMTDPNNAPPDDVTSMASSVFTNHLPANCVGYPGMPMGQPSLGQPSVAMAPHSPASVQPPPPGIKGEVTKMAVPPHESRVLATASEGDSESSYETDTESESESEEEGIRPTGYKSDHSMGKSSWDALKEASEKQLKESKGAKLDKSADMETSSKMFTVV